MKYSKLLFILSMIPLAAFADGLVKKSLNDFQNSMPPGSEEIFKKKQLRQEEMNKKGYISEYSDYAKYLLEMRAGKNLIFTKDDDTHLKKSLKDIKLAFPFKEFPNAESYTPFGARIDQGWTGIKIFFNLKEIGYCSYTYMDLKQSNTEAQIVSGNSYLEVNRKPAFKEVIGRSSSGYLYTIRWYDNNSFNSLECANKDYQPQLVDKVLLQSKVMDKLAR